MIFGSVCSGIEAASVAWQPLGWRAAFFSEIEAFPRAVLKHRHAAVPLHGDFTTIGSQEYEPIELLVGGTPCQDFSVAGLRAGLDGQRGALTLEFLALARRLQPRWLVWENVPGLLSIDGGRAFGAFLGLLGQCGYGFAYRVLDAQHFGVPQRRRRIFVVGHLGDWRRAAAVLFERESLLGHPAPSREARQGIALPLGTRVDRGGSHREAEGNNLIAYALNAKGGAGRNDGESETFIAHSLRADGFDASEDGTGRGTPLVCGTLTGNGDAHSGFKDEIGLVAFNITPSNSNKDYNARPSDRSQELTAGGNRPSARGGDLIAGMAVRRLTPREAERLQGFPDDYTAVPYRGKMAADGPRYKALGNSMAVPCMRWIGERIALAQTIEARRGETALAGSTAKAARA